LAEAEPRGGTPQQRRLIVAAMASILLCAAAVASWWVTSYLRSVHDMARLEDDVRRARPVVDAVPVAFDPDPRALLPALNAARALARAQVPTNGPPISSTSQAKRDSSSRPRRGKRTTGCCWGRSKGGLHKLSMRCCAPGLTQTSSTRRSRSLSASTSRAFQRHRARDPRDVVLGVGACSTLESDRTQKPGPASGCAAGHRCRRRRHQVGTRVG